ncbi:Ig-like domain-containing protein [Pectobacterium actinidiae]|uniref:Ig-like domain-containing protein n=1 Tax=Pectobacterium actinidiae TaxID=1507808 RepID=UPI002A7EF294|nr:Ig-like domain-containing protein [Pectobacterium actinidiae]MDY4314628.1 Ig-like domain-containing protein [Pectobacterium actinidiae]
MSDMNVIAGNANILSRQDGQFIRAVPEGTTNVQLLESSTVRIYGTPDIVSRYERIGDDLILHMTDGTTVRYESFFTLDAAGYHSELVFDDGTRLIHAQFSGAAAAEGAALAGETLVVVPEYATLSSLGAMSIGTATLSTASIAGILGGLALATTAAVGISSARSDDKNNTTSPDPSILISPLTGDNILNGSEVGISQQLSGTTANLAAGTLLTITLNDVVYQTRINADGSWSLMLPSEALAALANGEYALKVSSADGTEASITLLVDTTAPTLTLEALTGDDLLTADELQSALDLLGSTSPAEAGQTVSVTLNGITYTGIVAADGSWKVTLPADALLALTNGDYTLSVSLTDKAGNTTTQSKTFTVNTNIEAINISTVSADNYLNALEAQQPLTINGTTANIAAGQTVTLTLNGKTYTATVGTNGNWSATLPPADLQALPDGQTLITASVPGINGTISTEHTLSVLINTLPQPIITLPFEDGVLDTAEAGQDQIIRGSTGITGSGQQVTLTLDGKIYTGTVDANGNWQITLPSGDLLALPQGENAFTITVTDIAGNQASTTTQVTVSFSSAVLTLNAIAGDDILNTDEGSRDQLLSGTASLSEAGRIVTVTLNGTTYTATIGSDGHWSLTLPAADLQALGDGEYLIRATLTDVAGNITTLTRTLTVDTTAPTLTLEALTGDDLLTADELQSALDLLGSTSPAEAGQTVSVTLNGITYTGIVAANGSWKVTLPADALLALTNGDYTLSVSLTDKAGNTTTQSKTVTVNTNIEAINISTVSADNYLNALEAQQPLTINGTTAHIAAGQIVTLTLNGKTYTATVGSDGNWSATLPPADLQALADGQTVITASVPGTDGTVSVEHTLTVLINTLPQASLDLPFEDGILNASEAALDQVLTGNTGITGSGQSVSITLNGENYAGTVDNSGNWIVTLPPDVLQALPEGNQPLTVIVKDIAGNVSETTQTISVNIIPLTLTVSLTAGDDVINATELLSNQIVSGTASISEAGRFVSVLFNGKTYRGVIENDGTWRTTLPAVDLATLTDGSYDLIATVSDAAGNTTTVTRPLTIDTGTLLPLSITLDPFANDNIVDAAEINASQQLSGKTENIEAGQIVTITLNGMRYFATIQAGGGWRVNVPEADMLSLPDGVSAIDVSVSDRSGNSVSTRHDITVDRSGNHIAIGIISTDNLLNLAEAAMPLAINGTTSNIPAGQTVTLTLNGTTYTTTVLDNGRWAIQIPSADLQALSDGNNVITASVNDADGVPTTASHNLGVYINTLPQPTINTPFEDAILNSEEATVNQTITGRTGISGEGQSVMVQFGGNIYIAAVDNDGNWALTLSPAELQQIAEGNHVLSVTALDAAGNQGNATLDTTIDFTAPTITIGVIAGDDIINIEESGNEQLISGTASIREAGQSVTLSFNGQTFSGVVGTDGNWNIVLPPSAFSALVDARQSRQMRLLSASTSDEYNNLPDGGYDVFASLSSAAGITVFANRPITLSIDPRNAPTVTIDPFVGTDNHINGAEAKVGHLLTGSTTNVEAGQSITITLNGKVFFTTVEVGGTWQVPISAAEISLLQNGTATITASVSNKAGNVGSAENLITVDVQGEGIAISIVASDDIINRVEASQPLTISGATANVAEGETVTLTLNNKIYTSLIAADGSWSIIISSADLQALQDGIATVTATVETVGGEAVSDSKDLGIYINTVPQPTLDTPFSDGVLNVAEAAANQTLTGTTGIIGASQTVTVTLNNKVHTATVDEQGNWSVVIPSAELQALTSGQRTISVQAIDAAGNSTEISTNFTADLQPPLLSMKLISTDGIINSTEILSDQTLSGNASLSEVGRTVTVILNNKQYTAIVQIDGQWSTIIPTVDLQALENGNHALSATLSDAAGNVTTSTQSLLINTVQPILTLNAIALNNIIDGAEVNVTQQVSGASLNLEPGQLVSIKLGSDIYTTKIGSDGQWSVDIPSAALTHLTQGINTVTVSASDKSGNTVTLNQDITLNTALSGIAIDTIAGDNRLNQAEIATALTINGSTQNVAPGSTVSLVLNGKLYTGTTQPNGSWNITISPADLQQLADGKSTLIASTVDSTGNTLNTSHTIGIFTNNLPALTLNTPFMDGVLNAAELGVNQTISGNTGITSPDQVITATFGGMVYTGVVNAAGQWSITLSASHLQALTDGVQPLRIDVSDEAGNSATLTRDVTIDRIPPALTMNNLGTDTILNAVEVLTSQTVSGTASLSEEGRSVIVTLNGKNYLTTVDNTGNWRLDIPTSDLTLLADGGYNLTASLTDAAGNTTRINQPITIDTSVTNPPQLTIYSFATNNIVDGAEARVAQIVSGDSINVEAGQVVTLTLNGKTYTALVGSDGSWHVTVPSADMQLLTNGSQTIIATVTDISGNPATASSEITVNTLASGLSIEPITGDNQLNAAEAASALTINGNTDNVAAGSLVSVTLNGKTYVATVQADGSWSTSVPPTDLALLGDGPITIGASTYDLTGNLVTNSQQLNVSINHSIMLLIDTPFDDGYLNLSEAQSGQTLSGTTGLQGPGQEISVTIGGQTYSGMVDNTGNWDIVLPPSALLGLPEGMLMFDVTVQDISGNTATLSSSAFVDLTPPVLTINTVSNDDIINIAESNQPLIISGTAPANDSGQIIVVNVAINGQIYQGAIQADGSWNITIPAGDLVNMPDGATLISASLTDVAGNTGSVSHTIILDTDPSQAPRLSIGIVSTDDYINQAESLAPLTLSGTSQFVEPGQQVTIELNNKTYVAQTDASGNWSVQIPANDVSDLPDGLQPITASVSDIGGNATSTTHNITVITDPANLPGITISTLSGNDVVSAQDSQSDLLISGSTTNVQTGQRVTVMLNNKTYLATVGADGNWNTTVPASDVQNLPQGNQDVTATVSDIAQNPATTTHQFTVDTLPPLLSIDMLADTSDIGLADALAGLPLSGKGEAGLLITIKVGTAVYSAVADSNGVWQISITANDLLALGDGVKTLEASVTDGAGNPNTTSIDITLKTQSLPTLTLNALYDNNVLSRAELATETTIGGSYTNLPVGTAIQVTIGAYTVTGVTLAGGLWSATIPANALNILADGNVQVSATVTDSAGNTGSAGGSLDVVIHTNFTISIATPFVDGVLNQAESTTDQLLTGTTGLLDPGQNVSVSITNGTITSTYNATVTANGQWSVTLPAADLSALGDGTHTINVTVTDHAGNTGTGSDTFTSVIVGVPVASLDTPFGDGKLSLADAQPGVTLSGQTGLTSNVGQTVSVSINGTSVPATVNADGSWSLSLDRQTLIDLPDGTVNFTVTVTDSAGNTSNASATANVLTTTMPIATLDLPFGDGILNTTEIQAIQTLTGKTGITSADQEVIVTVTNKTTLVDTTFTAIADGLGGWSRDLSPADLAIFTEGDYSISVKVTDWVGNSNTSASLDVSSAQTLPAPIVDVNPFGGDNILSSAEAASVLTFSGRTQIGGNGQSVKLEIDLNGIRYTGTVDNAGNWSVTLPQNALNSLSDGQHTITITATDAAGNIGSTPILFTSDFTPPALTLNTPFDDGYLSIAEADTLLGRTLSGNAGDAASMTVTLGGQSLVVQITDGVWTAELTPTQLGQLADGTHNIVITATDDAGNSATLNSQATIAQTAPTLDITTFAGLDGLSYAESRVAQIISGTSTGLEVGQNVTVRLNSVDYTGKILAGGAWSVTIPSADLQALANTTYTITVDATDKAGNPATPESVGFNVNLTQPALTMVIDAIANDDIINAAEMDGNLTLSGRVTGITPMSTIAVSIGGVPVIGTIITDSDGFWTTTISARDYFTTDGSVNVSATTVLPVPLIAETKTVLVDTTPPTLDIVTFAGDNVLNRAEASTAQTITGTASTTEAGQLVSVVLNGKTYTAQVSVTGDWSVNVPAADLAQLGDGTHTITATLADSAGNTTTDTQVVTVDTDTPLLSISLFDDNILTLAEALVGGEIKGTGEPNATVTLTAGPLTGTTTVGSDGTWTIPVLAVDLQSLVDGPQVIGVTLTDTSGNSTHLDVTLDVALNQTLGAGINDIFGNDGILNLAESLVTQVISGNATGDYLGAKVQVTVLGTTVEATVGANGTWSVSLPPTLLGGLSDGLLQLNVAIVDSHGNVKNELVDINVLKSLPVINSVVAFTDGALNAAEAATSQIISGVVSNVDIAAGASVSVTLGNKVYAGITVGAGGAWSLSVPALDLQALQDGTLALGVAVTDHAGNTASQIVNVPAIIKTLPSITLNPVFGDSLLNLSDLLVNQTLSGTATGLAGRTITLSISGSQIATATVGSDGKWSAAVTPSVLGILQGMGSGDFTVSATATDAVGNSTTGSAGIKFDFAQPVITLNPIFGGDGFLNAAEALVAQTISGVATNAAVGSQVTVTLGSKTFLSTVGANGAFSLTLQPTDLSALADGSATLGVSITNASGNTSTVSSAINIIAKTLPTIGLGSLFGGDGFLNVAEAALTQTISGTTTNAAAGSTIAIRIGTLTLNTTVGNDGTWSTSLTPLQLSSLANGNLTVSATVTDPAGNSNSISAGLNVSILPPTITLTPLFNNGVLDLSSLLSAQSISGTTNNVAAGTTISVTLGSKTYTTTVGANGSWSLPVPSLDLKALVDGVTNVGVRLVDAAGNVGETTSPLNVIINALPTIAINPLFGGDGLLNAVEAAAGQVISGTSTNAIGSTIQISLGTKAYSAVVQSDGTWSVSLPSLDLSNLTDGTLSLSASLTNSAGKTTSAGVSIGVGVHTLPTVSLGSLFGGDGYLNLAEAGVNQLISGTTTNAAGGSITLTVGGFSTTVAVANNGTWSVTVPSADLTSILDGNLSVGVTVTDRYGNTNNTSSSVIVKTHQLPQLGIDAVGSLIGNTVGLLANGVTISGTSRYVQQGAKVTVTLLGQSLQGTVGADGKWSAHFTSSLLGINLLNVSAILTALLGTAVEASVTDLAGNFTGVSAGLTFGVVIGLPTMSAAVLDVDDSSVAQLSSLSIEQSDTEESTDVQPLQVSSTVAAAALSETHPIDNSVSTDVEESVYAIGGVVISLADGSVQTGTDIEGSEGDDLITLSTLDFTQIDGGDGIDTLVLNGTELNLDLTELGLKVDNVEIFDLGQNGTNSITLDLDRALNVTDRPEDDLLIVGGEGNRVNLIPGEGAWSTVGQRDIDGQHFDVYHHSSLDNANNLGDVLVQQGLLVNMV